MSYRTKAKMEIRYIGSPIAMGSVLVSALMIYATGQIVSCGSSWHRVTLKEVAPDLPKDERSRDQMGPAYWEDNTVASAGQGKGGHWPLLFAMRFLDFKDQNTCSWLSHSIHMHFIPEQLLLTLILPKMETITRHLMRLKKFHHHHIVPLEPLFGLLSNKFWLPSAVIVFWSYT
ncbi:hypothetical protein Tco_0600067 [Tanacetum coccineum]|uniref:Uncharacterized protein n=1 Tax=Tanacetum coccineum TaxID=301880 RepID=A0ABQ4WAR5_9ASTR